jgi:ketosteroid isomerase-like protein
MIDGRRGLGGLAADDVDPWPATLDTTLDWHTGLERLVEGTKSFDRGHDGMRRFWNAYRTEFEDFAVEAHELRDLGGDRVVLLGRVLWRGPASRIATESPVGMVFTVRGGKIIQSVDYFIQHEVAEDAGLARQ